MTISAHALSVDIFTPALTNLAAILDKGVAHATARKFDPNLLASSRLAPDMLPLTRQVQIACDMAKNSVARLAGMDPPRHEDNEKTIDELRARIAKTLDFLKSVPASALEGAASRDIRFTSGQRTLEFKGLYYLQRWAIPNVFFHCATAYNILRNCGVEIGKMDYLGSP